MKIRGDRKCKSCEARWSYYETGSVTCPECGSPRSVGVDDRKEHTASPATLDLTTVRDSIEERPLSDSAADAATICREYVRKQGFINAGDLCPLDDTYLAATELLHVARTIDSTMRVTDDEEYYLLALLGGADTGERPATDDVPESMRAARGLAYATAVGDYRSNLRRYLDSSPDELARKQVATLGEHQKRIEALDGDVSLTTAETLVSTARAIGRYLIEHDETALTEARSQLDSLDSIDI